MENGNFATSCDHPELIETHISWVICCNQVVYKIKKPIRYSFLDFSTPEKRKHYCEREVELNRRLTADVYLDVVPVWAEAGRIGIGLGKGQIVDHAVLMVRMDPKRQMDVLLQKDEVTIADIRNLASRIARFHETAIKIFDKDIWGVQTKFNDLAVEKNYLRHHLGSWSCDIIDQAIEKSNGFLKENADLLNLRRKEGFIRDCHGDLHARNIFLLPDPVIFDCIEFSDDFRQIDLLNEVAFLCMDLDAFGREDLSGAFISEYNALLPAIRVDKEEALFTYYKSYRANVRAKVNSLRARDDHQQGKALNEVEKYLRLMQSYLAKMHA
jgi:uncharacterized protein